MTTQTIEEIIIPPLKTAFPACEITISGTGCGLTISIIGEVFAGKNRLERHRLVNQVLFPYIQVGTIHAVTIVTKTPDENNKELNRG